MFFQARFVASLRSADGRLQAAEWANDTLLRARQQIHRFLPVFLRSFQPRYAMSFWRIPGLSTFILPNENGLEEIAERLSLAMTSLHSV